MGEKRTTEENRQEEYGCLFCKTGAEEKLIKEISLDTDCQLLFAKKKTRRRIGKEFKEVVEVLFPGYIFFKAPRDFQVRQLGGNLHVFKVLTNDQDSWCLQGDDRRFAELLFAHNGLFGFSQAYYEGQRIKIISGPLKEYEAKISKVNKRFQNGQIEITLNNRAFKVWLSFELVQGV